MEGLIARLTEAAPRGEPPARADALALLQTPDEQLLAVVASAYEVRRTFFGNRVKLNFLLSMKTRLCAEDFHYCSQRRDSTADILKYPMFGEPACVEAADRAVAAGAKRLCMVASGRGPTPHELKQVTANVRAVKAKYTELEICACLGLLRDGEGARL